ncbi:MAG: sulfatase-like hydrolase/transferase [Sulfurimonas sp.]|nr:sulfatase-like hydrolase/transferase [Sulfurimonas sp.]
MNTEDCNKQGYYILNSTNLLVKYLYAHLLFLLFMSLFRLSFFLYYNPLESLQGFYLDIFNAFMLGFRIDLTVIGYIQALPTILIIANYYIKKEYFFAVIQKISLYYLFIMYSITSLLLVSDFGFYSYFKEHINILFFGLLDDDTRALAVTIWQNYNVVAITLIAAVYFSFLYWTIKRIFLLKKKLSQPFLTKKYVIPFFLILITLNFLAIRGTFGMYPLGKMIPNISTNEFINQVSQNGVRAFASAYSYRKKYLEKEYDLIKKTGFKNNIEKAFEIYKATDQIDRKNLLNNITFTTKENLEEYNVVVIIVESFGLPIIKYSDETFNLLGDLKSHFQEDLLFTECISSANGTILNLQSLLLNIPYLPNSFALSQSIHKQTSFTYSPAFLYTQNGYETSFIYGGDLTWRDLGSFIKFQGYKNLEGKTHIFNNIQHFDSYDYFHPWGIHDEFLYQHIFNKLKSANQKQFIMALTTNNHPPYNIPKQYHENLPKLTPELEDIITGDKHLAKERFASFQYALHSLSNFLDKLKSSPLKDNTIVVVTADDHTVDGIMKYHDRALFQSKNIPLYFYLPAKLKNTLNPDLQAPASHKDIFPTLYNLTLNKQKFIAIGNNLFDTDSKKIGFNGGNMIVHTPKGTKQLKSLEEKTEDEDLLYYKASLAISEYLLNQF